MWVVHELWKNWSCFLPVDIISPKISTAHNCFINYIFAIFKSSFSPFCVDNNIQITAWLFTLELSFSAANKSNVAPKLVKRSQWRSGCDMMISIFLIWLRHLYLYWCSQQMFNRNTNFFTTSITGNLDTPNSSWVFCFPHLLIPYRSASTHSITLISFVSFDNISQYDTIIFYSTPHSRHRL